MNCAKAPAPEAGISKGEASDGGYYNHDQVAALRRRSSQVLAALALLSALSIALLGVSIAAIVQANDAQAAVDSLTASQPAPGESAGAATTSGTAAAPAVYTSTDPNPPEGYLSAGSLYRGSGYWSNSSSNLPSPRSEFATAVLPGAAGAAAGSTRVLILGGLDADGAPTDSILSYDAVLDLYNTSLAPMPSARARLAAAAPDADTVVVVGGYTSAAAITNQSPESCLLVYTLSNNSWASDCGSTEAVADACAAAINGTVYVVGGTSAGGQLSAAIRSYSPATGSWAQVASLPSARAEAACAAVGGTLYIAGGRSSDGSLLNEFLGFDTSTGELKSLSAMPYGSGDMELVALPDGSLLSIGGIANTSTDGIQAPTHFTQQYLPIQDVWVQKAPIALARLRSGAAYAAGGVYAFGGVQRCTAAAAGGACEERPFADVEVFYDVEHPPVFVHVKDPAATSAPEPAASKVLLRSDATPQAGFTNQGLLHAGSGYWAPEQGLPVPALADHAVVSVGNSLFIIGGGLPNNQTITADVWEFDTVLATYTRRSPMPAPRHRAGAAAVNGKIYVAGGYSTTSEQEGPQGLVVYDVQADKWTVSDANLTVPRSDACMAAVDGLLYLGGGYSTNYAETLDSVEVFDPNTNTWTELARPMPTPRGDVMCTTFALAGVNHFVMVGGYWDPTNQFTVGAFRTEVEAYNPAEADWVTLAPIPQARGDNALVTLPDNRMLVLGGETSADGRNQVASNGVDLYLAGHDVWVQMAPMPEPRFRFDAAFANGFTYVFGGDTTSLCTTPANSTEVTCTARGGTQNAFKFLDVVYPDVFVFVQDE